MIEIMIKRKSTNMALKIQLPLFLKPKSYFYRNLSNKLLKIQLKRKHWLFKEGLTTRIREL